MDKGDAGGLVLIAAYLGITIAGELIAYLIGRQVEIWYPTWSLIAFLTMFMAVIIAAWPIALKATSSYAPAKPN